MKKGVFITGTDTHVGKTIASAFLVSAIEQKYRNAGYWKPIQTGQDDDTMRVRELSGVLSEASPEYRFSLPAAPSRAAIAEGKEIQLDAILNRWNKMGDKTWVVEGAGGLLVPLNDRHTIRDLIKALKLSVVIVASTKLGTMNHTLLTIEALKSAELTPSGVIFVGHKDQGLVETMSKFMGIPVLGEIPWFTELTPSTVRRRTLDIFTSNVVNKITGGAV